MNKTAALKQFLKLPTTEDLNGAAEALVRLQETYNLDTTSVANGELNGVQYRCLVYYPVIKNSTFQQPEIFLFFQISAPKWLPTIVSKLDDNHTGTRTTFIRIYGCLRQWIDWQAMQMKTPPNRTFSSICRLILIIKVKRDKKNAELWRYFFWTIIPG